MGILRRQSRLSSSDSDSDKSRSKSRSSSRSRSRSSSPGSKRSSSRSKSRSKSGSRSSSKSGSRSSSSSSASGGKASGKSNASSSSAGSNKSKKLVKASDRKASTALLAKLSDSSDSDDEKEDSKQKEAEKRKKSSPGPEPSKAKKKKDDFMENNDHFDDGLDDDLIGDDEDRQKLEDMTEKEREEELFRRAERREELKKRFEITKKLKLQNKDKLPQDDDKSDGEVSSASGDEELKKSISREQESGRQKGYEVKHASKFNALSQLKAQREERERKEQARKEKEAKRKKESSGSDNSDMEKLAKKSKKSKAADIYSSSSDSDAGKNERRRSSSSSSSSSSGSGSQSSGESDTERHSSKKTVKKIESIDNKGDLEKIRLSRFKLDKFVHLPIFQKTVVGCFVRISIGNHPEKGAMYRIAEIVDVCETAKVYDVMKNRTNIGLKVRHGKNARVFRAQFVSNQHFEESEFEKWKQACAADDIPLPTTAFIEDKVKQIQYALTYRFSNNDVEKILASKEKFSKGPKNYAVYKARLQRERINALNEGNNELVEEYDQKLADHEEKAEKLDQKRSGSLSTVSLINDRNRKGNIDRAMKGLKEEEERIKREGYATDPFTRRKTRPTLAIPKEQKMTTELLMKLEEEKKVKQEKENVDKPKAGINVDEKPAKKDVPDIFNAHDFDIDIDINPAESQVTMASMGVRPVASNTVQPLGPTKKSIKLEDYKKRKGII